MSEKAHFRCFEFPIFFSRNFLVSVHYTLRPFSWTTRNFLKSHAFFKYKSKRSANILSEDRIKSHFLLASHQSTCVAEKHRIEYTLKNMRRRSKSVELRT